MDFREHQNINLMFVFLGIQARDGIMGPKKIFDMTMSSSGMCGTVNAQDWSDLCIFYSLKSELKDKQPRTSVTAHRSLTKLFVRK